MKIDFSIVHDIRHEEEHTFKYGFALAVYCNEMRTISKRHIRNALRAFMEDFGPEGDRWTHSVTDPWFAYVRFKDEADAMLFKLTH